MNSLGGCASNQSFGTLFSSLKLDGAEKKIVDKRATQGSIIIW